MLQWSSRLYVGVKAEAFKDQIRTVVEKGLAFPEAYLITLSANEAEQLDIIETKQLIFWKVHRTLPKIVGIALTRKEALDVVLQMALDIYEETGDCDFRAYFS